MSEKTKTRQGVSSPKKKKKGLDESLKKICRSSKGKGVLTKEKGKTITIETAGNQGVTFLGQERKSRVRE